MSRLVEGDGGAVAGFVEDFDGLGVLGGGEVVGVCAGGDLVPAGDGDGFVAGDGVEEGIAAAGESGVAGGGGFVDIVDVDGGLTGVAGEVGDGEDAGGVGGKDAGDLFFGGAVSPAFGEADVFVEGEGESYVAVCEGGRCFGA